MSEGPAAEHQDLLFCSNFAFVEQLLEHLPAAERAAALLSSVFSSSLEKQTH